MVASSHLTPEQRRLRGRIGGFRVHALHGDTGARARAEFLARFEREVDPLGLLMPEEREKRAGAARRAYFARLAFLSAKARSAKSGSDGES